jgi:small-conductance mechanosensitive channel
MLLRYLLIGLLLSPGLIMAAPSVTEDGSEIFKAALQDELKDMSKHIDAADNTLQSRRQMSEYRKQLIEMRSQARDCLNTAVAKLQPLKERSDALGPVAEGEDPEIARLRKQLASDISRTDIQRATCEQVVQVTQDMQDRIEAHEQAALIEKLLARGVSSPAITLATLETPLAWSRLVSGFVDEGSGWERLSTSQRWSVISAILLLVLAGIVWRRRWFRQHEAVGMRQHLVASSPWIAASVGACILLIVYLPKWPPELITRLVIGILVLLVFDLVQRYWLDGRKAAGLEQQDARVLNRWLNVLAGLLIVGALLFTAEAVIQLPDPHYFFLRTGMAWLLFAGLLWSAVIMGRVPGLAGTRGMRVFVVFAALTIAVVETLGFRNLSVYLLLGLSGSAAGFGICYSTARLFVFLFDGLDEGRYAWQKTLRHWMGLRSRETVPGLLWLRLVTSLLIWSAFLFWVLWVWGQSERWISQLMEYATEGFDVGTLHIALTQLLGAIVVLAVGFSLTRWMKQRVITELVKRTQLDRGGKEAIVTVSGYVGVVITLLIALGVAGISYTNLAIVAGALSVGIGFGLQNVVNNFVSGLILLFERPVRTGDWVVVGDTQGYVRKISIRSTQIETFDRADVIVPNSELVANKVSNWMLRDPWGRITLPVGVAYGSDVDLVIDTLVGVANAHEGVLKDQAGVAPPKALFRRFGDSALEFELRCFIRQIDRAFDITSDLNRAIDRAFREAGITIPFPQRDVYLKSMLQDAGPQVFAEPNKAS